eukprot:CAMPEP_0184484636 /NCGR_PEP_ID=MMETSP0113_2-20130426/6331_1 /TAXON_ID=91329 /ORGANISM="Norrisiella sphaerica, Strain BC52" /LENGTH=1486 /DNA_ID=CAMNT_0026865713 /DNA_START=243 /DNA_END=4703 /DNA_ORIENTATION=+
MPQKYESAANLGCSGESSSARFTPASWNFKSPPWRERECHRKLQNDRYEHAVVLPTGGNCEENSEQAEEQEHCAHRILSISRPSTPKNVKSNHQQFSMGPSAMGTHGMKEENVDVVELLNKKLEQRAITHDEHHQLMSVIRNSDREAGGSGATSPHSIAARSFRSTIETASSAASSDDMFASSSHQSLRDWIDISGPAVRARTHSQAPSASASRDVVSAGGKRTPQKKRSVLSAAANSTVTPRGVLRRTTYTCRPVSTFSGFSTPKSLLRIPRPLSSAFKTSSDLLSRQKPRRKRLRYFAWREALCGETPEDPEGLMRSVSRSRTIWLALEAKYGVSSEEMTLCEDMLLGKKTNVASSVPDRWNERKGLLRDVYIDVKRTRQKMAFFRRKRVQRALMNILVVYASSSPSRDYRQGMNELLAIIIIALQKDHGRIAEAQLAYHRIGLLSTAARKMSATDGLPRSSSFNLSGGGHSQNRYIPDKTSDASPRPHHHHQHHHHYRHHQEDVKANCSSQGLAVPNGWGGVPPKMLVLVTESYMEADAYALFCGLMEHVCLWYGLQPITGSTRCSSASSTVTQHEIPSNANLKNTNVLDLPASLSHRPPIVTPRLGFLAEEREVAIAIAELEIASACRNTKAEVIDGSEAGAAVNPEYTDEANKTENDNEMPGDGNTEDETAPETCSIPDAGKTERKGDTLAKSKAGDAHELSPAQRAIVLLKEQLAAAIKAQDFLKAHDLSQRISMLEPHATSHNCSISNSNNNGTKDATRDKSPRHVDSASTVTSVSSTAEEDAWGEGRRFRERADSSVALTNKFQRIHYELLGRFDPQLLNELEETGVIPQVYLLRWIRVLFSREIPLDQLLKVWDFLLIARPQLQSLDYFCVAMLMAARTQIMKSEEVTKLAILLQYPEVKDITPIIKFAYELLRGKFKRSSEAIRAAPTLDHHSAAHARRKAMGVGPIARAGGASIPKAQNSPIKRAALDSSRVRGLSVTAAQNESKGSSFDTKAAATGSAGPGIRCSRCRSRAAGSACVCAGKVGDDATVLAAEKGEENTKAAAEGTGGGSFLRNMVDTFFSRISSKASTPRAPDNESKGNPVANSPLVVRASSFLPHFSFTYNAAAADAKGNEGQEITRTPRKEAIWQGRAAAAVAAKTPEVPKRSVERAASTPLPLPRARGSARGRNGGRERYRPEKRAVVERDPRDLGSYHEKLQDPLFVTATETPERPPRLEGISMSTRPPPCSPISIPGERAESVANTGDLYGSSPVVSQGSPVILEESSEVNRTSPVGGVLLSQSIRGYLKVSEHIRSPTPTKAKESEGEPGTDANGKLKDSQTPHQLSPRPPATMAGVSASIAAFRTPAKSDTRTLWFVLRESKLCVAFESPTVSTVSENAERKLRHVPLHNCELAIVDRKRFCFSMRWEDGTWAARLRGDDDVKHSRHKDKIFVTADSEATMQVWYSSMLLAAETQRTRAKNPMPSCTWDYERGGCNP